MVQSCSDRKVATIDDSVYYSDKDRLFNHHSNDSCGNKEDNREMQRVQVIHLMGSKNNKRDDENSDDRNSYSDSVNTHTNPYCVNTNQSDLKTSDSITNTEATSTHNDAYCKLTQGKAITKHSNPSYQSESTSDDNLVTQTGDTHEVSATLSEENTVHNDISLLGALFPHDPSDSEAFSQHFNLEYLDDSFVFNLIENTKTEDADSVGQAQPTTLHRRDILSDAVGEIGNEIVDGNVISEKFNQRVKTVQKGRRRGRKLEYRSENSNEDNTLCGVCGAKVGNTFIT